MNERIKQLAEHARQHFPKTETSGEFWVFDQQKFAELIVRECTDILASYRVRFEDGFEYNHVHPIQAIHTHFGIK